MIILNENPKAWKAYIDVLDMIGESKSNLKNVFEETERSSSAVIFIIESMTNGKSSVERSRNYLL